MIIIRLDAHFLKQAIWDFWLSSYQEGLQDVVTDTVVFQLLYNDNMHLTV